MAAAVRLRRRRVPEPGSAADRHLGAVQTWTRNGAATIRRPQVNRRRIGRGNRGGGRMTYLVRQDRPGYHCRRAEQRTRRGQRRAWSRSTGRPRYLPVRVRAGIPPVAARFPAGSRTPVAGDQGSRARSSRLIHGPPDLYLDDDLFGYMVAHQGHRLPQRDTVLATGTLVAVAPRSPDTRISAR